ncbi:DNA glycosylase [Lobosporangium transversale]|uniref:Endonuclease III homolog n=1 Tax=Lobosporangium transversale TaxID=64571 RepID=A0A1Y2GMP4_9FUNG|nr:DNA glycosylase [Lobosporangium transversale]ORZ16061.1 DNA glycosylase [Lobosporangium transversale]|eukprot:XP_021881408.1 DNA glycosylase [Lobosporangium transversale]
MASEQIKEEEEVQGLRSLGAGAKKKSRYATKEPVGWEITLDRLREFRLQNPAPVDTMGCERLAEVGETIPPEVSRFQTLVSLLLSSQTKDTVTSVAVRRLQKELKGGLTIQAVLDAPSEKLNSIISAVGFHNKKTIFMKQVAKICRDQYNGDIPDTAEGLTALPGVGPKMAYLTLQVAWNKNLGIGVDTHVHRIANRLGWVKTEKDGPEATREALQSWLPKEHWREINYILVGFGQVLCLPRGPLCPICPVQDRCPSAMMSKKRIKTEVKMQMEEPFGEVEIHAVHTQLERANLQDQNVEEGKVGDGDVQVKEEEDATQVATKSHYFANNGDKQVEIKQEEGITDIMNDDTLAKSTASLIENLHVDGSNLEKESVDIEDLVN